MGHLNVIHANAFFKCTVKDKKKIQAIAKIDQNNYARLLICADGYWCVFPFQIFFNPSS